MYLPYCSQLAPILACLGALLAGAPATAQTEVITLRSGQVGGAPGTATAADDTLRVVQSGPGFLDPLQLLPAASGTPATVINPHQSWVAFSDPASRWVHRTASIVPGLEDWGPIGYPGGSVLYALEFTVETQHIGSAEISLSWLGDHGLGAAATDGLYLNGTTLGAAFREGNALLGEKSATQTLPAGLLQPGVNTLHFYQLDADVVAGLIFSGEIRVEPDCTTFADTEFDPSSWTATTLTDSGAGGSTTITQETGGNPGSYRRVDVSWGPGNFSQAHLLQGAAYDPSLDGAIEALTVSLDYRSGGGGSGCGDANMVGTGYAYVLQSGLSFAAPVAKGGLSDGWVSGTVQLSDFGLLQDSPTVCGWSIDYSQQPDGSASAAPLEFGFVTRKCSSSACSRIDEIDNFEVKIGLGCTSVLIYGSGTNPPGSMAWLSGTPALGSTLTLGVDNPVGTQGPGSLPFVVFSGAPSGTVVWGGPAGPLIPGFGMSAPGHVGEVLIATPSFLTVSGAPWTGTTVPVSVTIPNNPTFLGRDVYAQGVMLDFAPLAVPAVGLANAAYFQVGN